MKKNILVACGSGIATSTAIVAALKEMLDEEGYECNIEQCSILEIEEYEDRCNFIVSSSKLHKDYSIPSVNGVAFLTGVGLEETKEKIRELLNE